MKAKIFSSESFRRTALALVFVPALFSASCSRAGYEFTDFNPRNPLEDADESAFTVTTVKVTDLADGIPEDCRIPSEAETKTTSTPVNAIVADLFEYANRGKVIEIAGKYESFDLETGTPLTLSGKILLPKDRKPKRYILVSHYTIGSNAEAPSNSFPLEGVLCDMGYAMIYPDYQGYGIDSKNVHPYLVLRQTAYDVCMMFRAAGLYLKNTDYAPENPGFYLMGYSQGGAVTMATQWLWETALGELIEDELGKGTDIVQVFAGGGPYDVRATYSSFITSNKVNIPCAVPLVIQGMIVGTGMDVKMDEILQPWLYEKMDEWINSKKYTVAQLKEIIGTTKTSDLLTAEGMNPASEPVAELYKKMTENSIVAYDWTPGAPVYMLHSMDDDVVPFVNAAKAKAKWVNGNIQYNFGHYGTHMATALRFIYSVKTWLKDEEGK